MSEVDVYEKFACDIAVHTDKIQLKRATTSTRTGAAKARDRAVFGKMSWAESQSYLGVISQLILFTALIPASVVSINEFLKWIGAPFIFPKELTSISIVIFIIFIVIFGVVSIRRLGTLKASSELNTKMNSGMFSLWSRQEKIIEQNNKIMKKLGVDEK